MLRGFAGTVVSIVGFAGLLFLAAGRLEWPKAWIAVGLYAAISLVVLFLADPTLVEERLRGVAGGEAGDIALASSAALFLIPLTLVVAGLDGGRFHWSPPVPFALEVLALLAFALGYAFAGWAAVRNKFFANVVRIQRERGHRVVTDGPYRFVRHPGYAGSMLAFLAVSLALGSVWGLLPACLGSAALVLRTVREDRTLMAQLDGYRAYSQRVRYRLLPGVW